MARLLHRKEFCNQAVLDRIAARRKELLISQRQLADMLGYSTRTYVSRVELGSLPLSVERLPKWAEALKTTTDYLLYGNAEARNSSDEVLDMLISNYDQMTEDERKMLFDFSNMLLKRAVR